MSKGSRSGKEGTFIHFDTQSPSLSSPRAKSPSPPAAQVPAGADPPKRFQFIDNTALNSGSNNSTQVRRHVMQEFMRQKRWNTAKQQPSSSGKGAPPARQPVQKIRAQKKRSQQLPSSSSTGQPSTPGLTPPSTTSGHTSPMSSASFPSPNESAFQSLAESPLVPPSFPAPILQPEPFTRRKRTADIDVGDLAGHRPTKIIFKSKVRRKLAPKQAYARAFFLIGSDIPDSISAHHSTQLKVLNSRKQVLLNGDYLVDNVSRSMSHPVSLLSAARTDPFKTLPLSLDETDQELFDFYVNTMPTYSSGWASESLHLPDTHSWYLSVFLPEAMSSALSFQTTILAHASHALTRLRGFPESRISIEHRHRASAMLRKHFRRFPSDTTDSTIVAMLSAALLEDCDPRPERKANGWQHFRAAQKKIRDRGGPSALQSSPRLAMIVNWSDYMMAGYHSSSPSFFFDHHHQRRDMAGAARREVHETVDEFLQFLRCMEHLAQVQSNFARTGLGLQRAPLRYTSFAQESPISKILAGGPRPRPRLGNLQMSNEKRTIGRMACLLLLNAANWQYRHSSELVEAFLAEINAAVARNGLDRSLSSEALCQILLSGPANPALEDSERPWLIGRMLKLVKRLGLASWDRLENMLMGFLTLEGVDNQGSVEDWENNLRWEVFTRGAVEQVMPRFTDSATDLAGNMFGQEGVKSGEAASLAASRDGDGDAMIIP
ncbi:MAG: hypothetical protein Q9160_007326 [Pyrenula sp. 1 TL-2023]